MARNSGRLSRQQQRFVEVMVETGNATYSAAKAGYSSPQPRGSQNMQTPAIQEAVRAAQVARLHNDLLPKALGALDDALTKPAIATKDRIQAAKVVIQYAFGDRAGGAMKSPAEMSPDEITQALEWLKSELADRARPAVIEAEPIDEKAQDPGVFD